MTPLSQPSHAPFTWEHYRTWNDDERWELIEGQAYAMTPAPKPRHQRISIRLASAFDSFFSKKECVPFAAPTDVKLTDQDVVQPDLLVVCDPSQIRETHIEGSPTLVVEILSPSTVEHDRVRKLLLYARAGIQEYWIVTPNPPLIEVLQLDNGSYSFHGGYNREATLQSPTFPDLHLNLSSIFNYPLPPEEEIQVVREATPPHMGASTPENDD